MIASSAVKCLMLALIALACLGADEYRPTPKFAGKSIPDPPQQQDPWRAPQTKLPPFLVTATTALFDQGLADPRGCEYRDVEIGDDSIIKTRGFVLPARDGDSGRFAISWDGVVYPALSVGAPADLDKDIRTIAESMKRDRAAGAGQANHFELPGGFGSPWSRGRMFGQSGPAAIESRSPLRLCLLLRLGRGDLAEELFSAGTTWKPEAQGRDLTDYHISYLTLATDWATAVFLRLVGAHARGDDGIALDAARRLSKFARAAEAKAEEMGFQRSQFRPGDPPSYFTFLHQLPELLADQERRAAEPARGPIPPRGGDPTARIAALIRDFDQIDERQMSSPGAAFPGHSPLVKTLVAEGEPAVEPLLAALETDLRLTRSVSIGRGFSVYRFVQPVVEAELTALTDLLQVSQIPYSEIQSRYRDLGSRKLLARSLRDRWNRDRAISPNERWYGALRDDTAGTNRWSEAMSRIVQPKDARGPMGVGAWRLDRPDQAPMAGEELRSRRDPSVSELMARRIPAIGRSSEGFSLHQACAMAMVFDRWDQRAALPTIRETMGQCLAEIEMRRGQNSGVSLDETVADYLAMFTLIRARAGDRAALDEYAGWVRKTSPEELKTRATECFRPLWQFAGEPAIRDAARWLFNDAASPWVPLLRAPGSNTNLLFHHTRIYSSALVATAGFREGLLAALAIKDPMGTIQRGAYQTFDYKTGQGWGENFLGHPDDLDSIKPGVTLPFRVCDFIAWKVSSVEASPRCELYWPEDRRDRAVQACADYLKKYGDRFTADAPAGTSEYPKEAHLAFPTLDRPATADDVRAGRAIFSLEGQAEVRMVKVPAFPFKARWLTLKDSPVTLQRGDGTTYRDYDQDGWLWQAEEVRQGDRWERFFGFVGHHVIAQVPAAEVELTREPFAWGPLSSGLDARIEPVEARREAFASGQPIPMVVRIRNRRGVENTSPKEFLRRDGAGRPSLRRGVSLELYYAAPYRAGTGQRPGIPHDVVAAKGMDHFDPGDPAHPLGAFEVFDATQVQLGDWFEVTRPGSYRVRILFAADSGVGEGTSNDWHFTVEGP